MNNEECLKLQNIPASFSSPLLPFPPFLPLPLSQLKLGHGGLRNWGSGETG